MQEYFRLGKFHIFDAPIYVHWSVLAATAAILVVYKENPIVVVIALLSFFSIILIHEIGHAAVAHKVGCRVFALKVSLVHGVCEHEASYYEWDEVKIAWGGVLAQLLIAMLVFTLSSLGARHFTYFGSVLVFLGYYNLLVIPYNLLPIRDLDGYKAWNIIPLLYQHIKSHLTKRTKRDRRHH